MLICVALSQLMQNERGETALIASSGGGYFETATLLLQYGAVVNYQNKVRLLFIIMSMVHHDGMAQNGVLSLEQGGFCISAWSSQCMGH